MCCSNYSNSAPTSLISTINTTKNKEKEKDRRTHLQSMAKGKITPETMWLPINFTLLKFENHIASNKICRNPTKKR